MAAFLAKASKGLREGGKRLGGGGEIFKEEELSSGKSSCDEKFMNASQVNLSHRGGDGDVNNS